VLSHSSGHNSCNTALNLLISKFNHSQCFSSLRLFYLSIVDLYTEPESQNLQLRSNSGDWDYYRIIWITAHAGDTNPAGYLSCNPVKATVTAERLESCPRRCWIWLEGCVVRRTARQCYSPSSLHNLRHAKSIEPYMQTIRRRQ